LWIADFAKSSLFGQLRCGLIGRRRLRSLVSYVAGADAKAMYAVRLQLGEEAFRNAMAQRFFGEAQKAA
jgi:hypothetical protein